jgi:hypothetical protein
MKNILFIIFTLINLVNGIRLLNVPINNEEIVTIKLPDIEYELNLENKDRIGGTDNHGCIPGAGYVYCNYTDTCNRYNEPCIFKKNSSFPETPEITKEKDYSEIYVLINLENFIELL